MAKARSIQIRLQAVEESYEKSVYDEFVMPTVIVEEDGQAGRTGGV